MKRHVRLRDLDTLLAVLEAGGMRKAAQRLSLSQPAVTKAIHSLEDVLGVVLLDRSRRGVQPTAFGSALAERTRTAFDELRQAVRDIEHLADPQGGELHAGAMETISAGLLSVAVERMSRRFRRLRIFMHTGEGVHVVEHYLRGHLVEFAIVRPGALPLPNYLEGETLFFETPVPVVGSSHPLAKRRRISLEELREQPWITSTAETSPLSPLGRAYAAADVPMPNPRLISSSLQMRRNLLATGRWVTLMPRSVLHFMDRPNNIRALPVDLPPWDVPTMILTHRDRTMGPLASRFLDTVREVAAPFRAK